MAAELSHPLSEDKIKHKFTLEVMHRVIFTMDGHKTILLYQLRYVVYAFRHSGFGAAVFLGALWFLIFWPPSVFGTPTQTHVC